MSPVEAAEALQQEGVDPVLTPVQTLVHRAEGWPAALALATAWARRAQLSERVDPLGGDDHLFSEYFGAELLASLAPEMLRFLSQSSVLDQLSGPLCDEVLGRKGSAAMLAVLARGNVPLLPLDPGHECVSPPRPVPGDAPDAPPALRAGARARPASTSGGLVSPRRGRRSLPGSCGERGGPRRHRGSAVAEPARLPRRRTQPDGPAVAGRTGGGRVHRMRPSRAGGGAQPSRAGTRRRGGAVGAFSRGAPGRMARARHRARAGRRADRARMGGARGCGKDGSSGG